jgi:hypothetical protein
MMCVCVFLREQPNAIAVLRRKGSQREAILGTVSRHFKGNSIKNIKSVCIHV